MSILIKGVEMPTCCDKCFASRKSGDVWQCEITNAVAMYPWDVLRKVRLKDCPLIEIKENDGAIPISFIEKQASAALACADYLREQTGVANAVLKTVFGQSIDEAIDTYMDEATTLTMLITSWNKENDK